MNQTERSLLTRIQHLLDPGYPYCPDYSDSVAYVASQIAKDGQGILYGFTGYNSGGAGFIQIFDSATLPADTSVPKILISVAATSTFSWVAPGGLPKNFVNGIVAVYSSTGPTKTIGGADVWFNIAYK